MWSKCGRFDNKNCRFHNFWRISQTLENVVTFTIKIIDSTIFGEFLKLPKISSRSESQKNYSRFSPINSALKLMTGV